MFSRRLAAGSRLQDGTRATFCLWTFPFPELCVLAECLCKSTRLNDTSGTAQALEGLLVDAEQLAGSVHSTAELSERVSKVQHSLQEHARLSPASAGSQACMRNLAPRQGFFIACATRGHPSNGVQTLARMLWNASIPWHSADSHREVL